MDAFAIFGLQNFFSFLVYGLLAWWYAWPWLVRMPRERALSLLLIPHALRHVGLTILVPSVVSASVPRDFSTPVAYGDLVATILAVVALVALRGGWGAGIALAWIANLWGAADLLNALVLGIRLDASHLELGSFWYVVTFLVPILWVAHVMSFLLLLRRR